MLGLLGVVAPAWAQAPSADDTPETQHVVVTGSQLSATDMESSLPVQIITRQDIERSGITSVEELVARLSANSGNVSHASNIGDETHPGFTGVSLRGFGERSTLVLLNGRRVTNYAFSNESGVGVDLGQIPVAAIDRVEILTDGASAIYGSDAIAGVVNFILRSEFKGVETSAQTERPQAHGGGGTDHQTASFGLGSNAADGFNVFAIIDHQRQHELSARDRGFAADYQPAHGVDGATASSLPANVLVGNSFVNPAAPACTPATVLDATYGGCFYNVDRYNDLVPEAENLGALVRATLSSARLGETYLEVLASRQRIREVGAPTPVNTLYYSAHPDWVIPVGSPFYQTLPGVDGDIVDPFYRAISLGPRVRRTDTQAWRALVGWRGEAAGWDLDGAVMQSTTHSASILVAGYIDADTLQDVLASGVVDPFADTPAGDAALASTLIHGSTREARGSTEGADIHASRNITAWNGGIATLGFGAEARHESMRDSPTALSPITEGSGFEPYKSGQRDVQALYVEAILPVVPQVQAQFAARADRYSDFGTHVSPKLSLRWQPVRPLLFRGSIGAGFRAPSLPELFTAQQTFVSQAGVPDPERCPVTKLVEDCMPTVNYLVGGNPALRPETSRDITLGMVIAPDEDDALQINAWRITRNNLIGELGDGDLLVPTGRYDGRWVTRGPVDPAYPNLPGPVTGLVETNENLGSNNAMGIDVDLSSNLRTRAGKWTLHLAGTFQTEARWQHTLTAGWERGPWHATLDEVWKAGYRYQNQDLSWHRSSSYNVWGTQWGYGEKSAPWQFAVGAKNLLDTKPPFSSQPGLPQQGYNSEIADPRGRVWYAQATCRWH